MGPDVRPWCLWNLTDVTLADDDTNPIVTDDANRAIHNNVATQVTQPLQTMQVAPPDDQILNQSKLCHLVAKYATKTNGVIWWPNLQLREDPL